MDEIGDIENANGVYGKSTRQEKFGLDRRSAIATESVSASSGHCVDDAGAAHDAADAVVTRIGDVKVAEGIYRDARGIAETSVDGQAAISVKAWTAAACHRVYHTRAQRHAADAVVEGVHEVEVAIGVHRNSGRIGQTGVDGAASVSTEAAASVAGDGLYDTRVRDHPADPLIELVRQVEIAGGVHCNAMRLGEAGADSGSAISPEDWSAIACHGVDDTGALQHAADAVAEGVRYVDVAGGVHRNATRQIEARVDSGSTVAAESSRRAIAGNGFDDCLASAHANRQD